jgi:hypothetical protein
MERHSRPYLCDLLLVPSTGSSLGPRSESCDMKRIEKCLNPQTYQRLPEEDLEALRDRCYAEIVGRIVRSRVIQTSRLPPN